MTNRYDPVSPIDDEFPMPDDGHTGKPDCPECAKFSAGIADPATEAELTAIADSLMEEWDGIINKFGNKLLEKARTKGKDYIRTLFKVPPQ